MLLSSRTGGATPPARPRDETEHGGDAMTEIIETRLPGVGIWSRFVTSAGERLGIITHHSGRRELIVCGAAGPRRLPRRVRLEEARRARLVRGPRSVAGHRGRPRDASVAQWLTIDWLPVKRRRSVRQLHGPRRGTQGRHAATIVAVVRERRRPSPPHHPRSRSSPATLPSWSVRLTASRRCPDLLQGE